MSSARIRSPIQSVDPDIDLGEYEESGPIHLSEPALEMLRSEVNRGDEDKADRIELTFNQDGDAILKARQYVGVVSLPDGPTIQIRPKSAGTNLLYLLQYAEGVDPTTFESGTPMKAGETFLDTIAALFEAELSQLMNQGLQSEYQRRQGTEKRLRGRLDLHRQLQRQPPVPVAFECTYDELTHDTVVNQAILYATTMLLGFVEDSSLTQRLQMHQQLLQRRVTLRPVSTEELRGVQLTRLNEHYEDIVRLTKLVLQNVFVSELEVGDSESFSLLVNMNTVYENTVERALQQVFSRCRGWRVLSQNKTQGLITGGKHEVTIKPDVTVYDETDTVRIVADAKWKTDSPKNEDFYQLTSYMLARNSPGLICYPDQEGKIASRSSVVDMYPLHLVELPTAADVGSFEEFAQTIESAVEDEVVDLIGMAPTPS